LGNLFACEEFRLRGRCLGQRDDKVSAFATQYDFVQKPRGTSCLVHGAVGQMPLLDHVQQIGLDFVGLVGGRVAPVVLGHAVDGFDVALLGALGKPALDHGVQHALA
jgi:hypothetical protein